MRILFVTPYYLPDLQFGGPPRKIHSIARGLARVGHTVRVLTFNHAERAARDEREMDGISVQYVPWRGRGLRQFPTSWARIRAQIERAEIVHCYGIYNLLCPIAARLSKSARTPFVIEPLGMYPPRARNQVAKQAYNLTISRWLMRSAAAVVAASANEAKELRAIAKERKIVCRRNGIDVDAFASLPDGAHLRAGWQIQPGEKVVLFVGRISPIKNLEQLVLAFAKAAIPSARLVLVGPAEAAYEARLSELIASHGLGQRVTLAGPLYEQDQKAALRLADLFVLPSSYESFGNAAAEAVAAGVPVLLTDTCGIAPLIHGRAGMAVPLGVDSLADGLRQMLSPEVSRNAVREDEAGLSSSGCEAMAGLSNQMTGRREDVKRELSWDEPIRQTEELYQRVIRNRKSAVTQAEKPRPGFQIGNRS